MLQQYFSGLINVAILNLCLLFFCSSSNSDSESYMVDQSLLRANSEAVINTKTGSGIIRPPSYTFLFSSALSGVPYLAYGVKNYYGDDYLGQQKFLIRRSNLDSTSFSVQVQIYGSTYIYLLNVPYIAVDPAFPHHMNSFDSVPIDKYSTLVNITVKQAFQTKFTTKIDYSVQAAGDRILNSKRLGTRINSLYIQASFRSGSTFYPVRLKANAKIIDEKNYQIQLTLYHRALITKLHYSKLFFNYDDVISSNKYKLQFFIWQTDLNGGYLQIPIQFIDNFILGLLDFQTIDGKCSIDYQWNFKTLANGTHGVELRKSVSFKGDCAFNNMRSTVFYMKNWRCDYPYEYFNLSSNLCQIRCQLKYFADLSNFICLPCYYTCLNCLSPQIDNCIQCSALDKPKLIHSILQQFRKFIMPIMLESDCQLFFLHFNSL